jgi:hypothetical protein
MASASFIASQQGFLPFYQFSLFLESAHGSDASSEFPYLAGKEKKTRL